MTVTCEHCHARKYHSEKLRCCGEGHGGSVHAGMPVVRPPPPELCEIIEPERADRGLPFDQQAFNVWKRHSRAINSCLAFASTQVREAHVPPPGGGGAPPFFAINGSVVHNIGPATASSGWDPRFAQMYFHDGDPAQIIARRQEAVRLDGVRGSDALIGRLENMIRSHSPFYHALAPVVQQWRQVRQQHRT